VVYDIADIGVQTKTRNFLRRYLSHIQLSTFEGEINPSQLVEIELFCKEIKLGPTDSIIIYILPFNSKVKRKTFGVTKEISNII
jgi:CRISPR-associated endonuclease Cas2